MKVQSRFFRKLWLWYWIYDQIFINIISAGNSAHKPDNIFLSHSEFQFILIFNMIRVLFCQKLFFLPAALAFEIYSVSSTQNKKHIATKSTFIVYSTFSVYAAFVSFSLMFSNLRVVIPLAFRDKTLFYSAFPPHILWVLSKDLFYRPKKPRIIRSTRCDASTAS